MSKHTPGPWKFVSNEWNEDQPRGNSPGSIASFTPTGEFDWFVARIDNAPEEVANARLIAAAPDLLGACGRALYHMALRGWGTTEGHELFEVYEQVKAAIRKAEAQ